ncbi:MAG: aspartate kinase [Crocinitomicaceae bacterium]|jgi:aspartate kinase|nr:aspartate kinase [Crocinitomicaceae bacterium]
MLVFKFGGASVKDASAVKNVAQIISMFPSKKKLIVVSAMGKTTNLIEEIVDALWKNNYESFRYLVDQLYKIHLRIVDDLFIEKHEGLVNFLEDVRDNLLERVNKPISENYDFEYDQIVSIGEHISTKIVEEYLLDQTNLALWIDTKQYIRTDNTYRNGNVDWAKTQELITNNLVPLYKNSDIIITQGFIGSTSEGFATTLGREGSDYTAGIYAYCLNAESVTIWKDVPGMLNADPKWFDDTVKLNQISFQEAIELAYYGATVIHPKTIKPLQNKNIPLLVKSFVNPSEAGTIISESTEFDHLIPSFIFKMNQIKIGITPKDFSFIAEENLSHLFHVLSNSGVQINLMQNSAISFDFVIDNKTNIIKDLFSNLEKDFIVSIEEGLELVTIRHYDQQTLDRVTIDKHILLTQKSEQTARILMRNI